MSSVVDRLVEIWRRDQEDGNLDCVIRNGDLSEKEALAALSSSFQKTQIEQGLEMFLFRVVEAYDNGELSYKHGGRDGLSMRSRAVLCGALLGDNNHLTFSRHLLQEMIRTYPVLEWHQTIRRIIEVHVTKTDVLYALADGLQSKRMGQVFSSATGLAFYAGYASEIGGTQQSVDHAIVRVKARIEYLLRKPSLPSLFATSLKAGIRHIEKWQ
ncbi:hypothetical protein Plim_1049 [Planctopirus limnophila DSM 3776]|uniref:Uncharacterized protein n=1 Tax=Planctopirus limnophila (strain ATCC 43296 / DSM 3776 / IFAM 1008 / Mu 290) TaxID=521674 RepID=D5STC1_PLAL2|nr:hypothetical protein [Planctopirus limnophila]ADG66889.1 hypothetical protein Plim_1049 [Planctopirus limnophila DSM 3776]